MPVQELTLEQRQAIIETPVTGQPGRTPRSEIEKPFAKPGLKKEPIQIIDVSGSNAEPASPDSPMTKQELLIVAIPLCTTAFAKEDTQAAAEAGTNKGGVRSYAADYEEAFTGWDPKEAEFDDSRDLGDLHEGNAREKLTRAFRGGTTYLMPAFHAAEKAFAKEFPAGGCVMEIILWTDGKADDAAKVEKWIEDMAGPKCVVCVAIVGYDEPGDKRHEHAVAHYRKLAQDSPYVSFVALTGVSDPGEAALDVQLMAA